MIKFIFKDTEKNTELVLPVTPANFEVSHGINIETINIHTLGDVALPGYNTLASLKVDCMFPAKRYPFNQPEAEFNPYNYIKKFEAWCDNRSVLRWIISETSVNFPVLISEITYGERDGSGDVYASIAMRQYRKLSAVQISKTGNSPRSTEKATPTPQTHVVKSGDTLSAICRKYYGNAALYPKLAAINGIKNPNLIYVSQIVKLPDKNLL